MKNSRFMWGVDYLFYEKVWKKFVLKKCYTEEMQSNSVAFHDATIIFSGIGAERDAGRRCGHRLHGRHGGPSLRRPHHRIRRRRSVMRWLPLHQCNKSRKASNGVFSSSFWINLNNYTTRNDRKLFRSRDSIWTRGMWLWFFIEYSGEKTEGARHVRRQQSPRHARYPGRAHLRRGLRHRHWVCLRFKVKKWIK